VSQIEQNYTSIVQQVHLLHACWKSTLHPIENIWIIGFCRSYGHLPTLGKSIQLLVVKCLGNLATKWLETLNKTQLALQLYQQRMIFSPPILAVSLIFPTMLDFAQKQTNAFSSSWQVNACAKSGKRSATSAISNTNSARSRIHFTVVYCA